MNHKTINIERSTYSALDLLGDVGGLFDGLRIILRVFLSPLVVLAIKDKVLT